MFGRLAHAGVRYGLAALAVLVAGTMLRDAAAEGDTRTLTMHHVHTNETITVTYKRDGHYDQAALTKLDWFLRDWRRNEKVHMDPHLFDVMWQAYRETGATKPIEIICGYRAPGTNALLRARSGGVAKFSQHILGKAIDFFIPGVSLAKLRAVGLKMQRGGVGFYPRSGSPFVHLDVGTVRHWPGISREQLVKIFPDGRTVHVPKDGKPLPGYAEALAEIEQRGNVPNARSLKLARAAGAITDRDEHVAERVAQNRKTTLVALVESGRDNGLNEDDGDSQDAKFTLASLKTGEPLSLAPPGQPAVATAMPAADPRPQLMTVAAAETEPAAPAASNEPAASTDDVDDVFARRFWPAPIQTQATPFKVASADTSPTGSIGDDALAYAAAEPTAAARRPAMQPLTMEAKALLGAAMAIGGQRLSSPWTLATMLTPSVSWAMTVSRLGAGDPRLLRDLLFKPVRTVAMNFSDDPQAGMTANRFTGEAVVFLATTQFPPQQTASLQ